MPTKKAAKKTRARSAKSGEFVSKERAKANPDTTVNETVDEFQIRVPDGLMGFLRHIAKSGYFVRPGDAAAHMLTEYALRCWLAANPYGGEA